MFFICGAYAATHLDTENRLWFNADVVKNAIVEFVPESKQQPTADLYQDLMDQTTGKISVDSLFKVCRKAGFNTYRYEGFTQCKSFIQKMLMDAEVAQSVDLNGFCPGLDEKGNNPNKLRSITDKTRIGDFCSSTNIRIGQVIFKPGYNCSCMASVCNPGFEFQGGACVTRIADGNGNCLREAYPKTSENNYLEKCKSFCEKKYAGRACKYTSVIISHSTGQCICNPNSTEIDAAYESMHQAKEKQINNLKYYEVCGDHKGKSGGTEVCVEGVFNWVNIGRLQASGLAEEYARVRYNDTIHCDTVNIRPSWNDDYVKCTSMNSKRYYEFQFDDVKESIDSALQKALVLGICKIHNVSSDINKIPGGYSGALRCNTACTSDMTKTARVFGLSAKTSGNTCNFSGLSMSAADAESKLAKIDGIDNYVFFHGVQIQGSQNVISQLRQYIKSTGKTVRTFDCNKNVGEIKNSFLAGDDDVMRCKLNGQPIDFVFDDFSESWLYVQEVGESKMQCIVSGGKFAGQECYGLTQKQCTDANAIYLKQNPGASGFRWDGKECVSIDANEAQFYDGAIQVGTGVIALVDCAVGTHLGCVLVMVETAGLATEMTTGVAIENRAGEFLSVSTRCKKRDCAISTIQNAGHVLSVMGALDATSLDSVDKELARLVGYLEPEDLSGVSDDDWDEIVRQLGGDPEDAGGTALVWLNRIGLGAQFLSIGTSGLRLTAKAITKLAGKGSRISRAASTVVRVLDTSGDAARAANNASDAARAANNASDAGRATNNASDAGRAANNASDAGRATNNASDAGRAANNTADSGRAANNASDAGRGTSRATNNTNDIVYDAAYFSGNATGADNVFKGANDIVQVNRQNMSAAVIRDLMKKAKQYGFECTDCGGDILKFSKSADNASDAARATSNAADAARGASKADDVSDAAKGAGRTADNATGAGKGASNSGRAASGASDAGKGGNAADNASKTSRAANLYEDWKVFGKGKNYEFDFGVLENNESELLEFIEMVKKDGYLVSLKGNKVLVKEVFSDLLERATTGIGSPHASKDLLSATRWEELNNQISHLMLKYVDEGDGFMKLTFDASHGAKQFSGNIGRYRVFLEKLPTADGGVSELVNIDGRAVAVVNVNGHRIPFYVSSGQAGKDALGIPSGKWYPIAGIGDQGWFNKMPDMNHNPVRELDDIVDRLERSLNAQQLKKYGLNGSVPESGSGVNRIINSEFKNGVVPKLEYDAVTGKYYMDPKYRPLFDANIQHIKDIFR